MTVSIQVDDRIVAALRHQAAARGLSLDEYLSQVADGTPSVASQDHSSRERSVADFDATLDELFISDSRPLPASSFSYSREDIYHDHD